MVIYEIWIKDKRKEFSIGIGAGMKVFLCSDGEYGRGEIVLGSKMMSFRKLVEFGVFIFYLEVFGY